MLPNQPYPQTFRNRSKNVRRIEEQYGESLAKVLIRLYYKELLNHAEIAERLGVPAGTIPGWFSRLGLNRDRMAAQAAAQLAEQIQ